MSALPHELPGPGSEPLHARRNSDRLSLSALLPIRMGRIEGIVVDLGLGGLRVRHAGALGRGTRLRLTILAEAEPVALEGEVLASRVVDLGSSSMPALYETRLRFTPPAHEALQALVRLVAALRSRDLPRLVSNLRSASDGPGQPSSPSRFVRLVRQGDSWLRVWTAGATQPPDGFVLPDGTDETEIELLCRTYDKLDTEGRSIIRRMVAAEVGQGV